MAKIYRGLWPSPNGERKMILTKRLCWVLVLSNIMALLFLFKMLYDLKAMKEQRDMALSAHIYDCNYPEEILDDVMCECLSDEDWAIQQIRAIDDEATIENLLSITREYELCLNQVKNCDCTDIRTRYLDCEKQLRGAEYYIARCNE